MTNEQPTAPGATAHSGSQAETPATQRLAPNLAAAVETMATLNAWLSHHHSRFASISLLYTVLTDERQREYVGRSDDRDAMAGVDKALAKALQG